MMSPRYQRKRQWKFPTNLVEFFGTQFCTNLVHFCHILIFDSLQFCTSLVQNFFLSLSIKQIPLFHIPKIAYRKAIGIRKFPLQIQAYLFNHSTSPAFFGFLLHQVMPQLPVEPEFLRIHLDGSLHLCRTIATLNVCYPIRIVRINVNIV